MCIQNIYAEPVKVSEKSTFDRVQFKYVEIVIQTQLPLLHARTDDNKSVI